MTTLQLRQAAGWLLLYLFYTLLKVGPGVPGQPLLLACLPVAGLCISSAYSQVRISEASIVNSDFKLYYIFTEQKGEFHPIHFMPHSWPFEIFQPPAASGLNWLFARQLVNILHTTVLILKD